MKSKFVDILLIVIVIDILLIVVKNTIITSYNPDSFYYIKMLPPYYYLGLIITLILVIKNIFNGEDNKFLNISLVLILCIYISSIQNFIVTGLFHYDVYGILTTVIKTINSGHLIQSNSTIYYSEFPIAIIFFSILKIVVGTSYQQMITYYQTFIDMVFPLFILLISHNITKIVDVNYKKYVFVPSVLISISLVGILAPLSYAIMMYCLFIYFYINYLTFKSKTNELFLITISSLIIFTNPTTAYIILFGLIIHSNVSTNKLNLKPSNFFILYSLILVAQTVYRSITTTSTIANSIKKMLYLDTTATVERLTITSPETSFLINYNIYIFKLMLIVLLSLISSSVIIYQLRKDKLKNTKIKYFIASTLLSYIFLFFLSFIALSAFVERPLTFIIILTSISMPLLLSQLEKENVFSKNVIISFIILLIILTVLNTGWYQPYNVVTTSEMNGRDFLIRHPELDIPNEWCSENVYIKRISNFEILRGENVKGYMENTDNKSSVYSNGNFIIYN